ncbi:Elongin-C [Fusarium odoratissimum]|uniref:Elongin-C n=3 Tax=Fusarium oxysporum species complex TaxID=171631 RepID=N1R731_FUSC4|nr:Elongin-C [Fusarium odoratissimum]
MVLDKVVEYFHYWYRYRDSEDVPDMEIPVELCLELLAAADYLGLDQYAAQPCIATTDCFDTNLIQGEYGHEVRSYEILTQIWA